MACIIDGDMPFSAREVAPPALSDWPVVSESKNQCNCCMKKEWVGMVPLLVSHSGELKGNLLLQVHRYVRNCL